MIENCQVNVQNTEANNNIPSERICRMEGESSKQVTRKDRKKRERRVGA